MVNTVDGGLAVLWSPEQPRTLAQQNHLVEVLTSPKSTCFTRNWIISKGNNRFPTSIFHGIWRNNKETAPQMDAEMLSSPFRNTYFAMNLILIAQKSCEPLGMHKTLVNWLRNWTGAIFWSIKTVYHQFHWLWTKIILKICISSTKTPQNFFTPVKVTQIAGWNMDEQPFWRCEFPTEDPWTFPAIAMLVYRRVGVLLTNSGIHQFYIYVLFIYYLPKHTGPMLVVILYTIYTPKN